MDILEQPADGFEEPKGRRAVLMCALAVKHNNFAGSTCFLLFLSSQSLRRESVLQSPCVHFTHLLSTRDRCTHALRGSSFAMIEKCQTLSSHVHPPSVRRSGLTGTISCAWNGRRANRDWVLRNTRELGDDGDEIRVGAQSWKSRRWSQQRGGESSKTLCSKYSSDNAGLWPPKLSNTWARYGYLGTS